MPNFNIATRSIPIPNASYVLAVTVIGFPETMTGLVSDPMFPVSEKREMPSAYPSPVIVFDRSFPVIVAKMSTYSIVVTGKILFMIKVLTLTIMADVEIFKMSSNLEKISPLMI